MCELEREICEASKNSSLSSPHYSTQYTIKEIKRKYNLTDNELCDVLQDMKDRELIREFGIRYSEWNPEVIDFYWFK